MRRADNNAWKRWLIKSYEYSSKEHKKDFENLIGEVAIKISQQQEATNNAVVSEVAQNIILNKSPEKKSRNLLVPKRKHSFQNVLDPLEGLDMKVRRRSENACKRLRKSYDSSEENKKGSEFVQKKKKPRTSNMPRNKVEVLVATPLPVEFENLIREMGGVDVKLVIHKKLFDADTKRNQNRLSVPSRQIKEDAKDFLTKEEDEKLEQHITTTSFKSIEVPLIEPNLERSNITLRKWDINSSPSYVLNGTWSNIRDRHKIMVNDQVQLWSFRVDGRLNFALVKVSTDCNEQKHAADTTEGNSHQQPAAE